MIRITPEVMTEISRRIEAPDYPSIASWESKEAPVYLDGGNIIFQTESVEDAERVLYALVRVIAGR